MREGTEVEGIRHRKHPWLSLDHTPTKQEKQVEISGSLTEIKP